MTIIANVYHSTRDFTWQPESNCFSAEDSTLSKGHTTRSWGQVYDDAADEGFVLVSHKTGDSVVCALDHVNMHNDEVAGWVYKVVAIQRPNKPGQWKEFRTEAPEPYNFTVLVIND